MTLLLLSNDANRAGAQLVLLHLMRLLTDEGIQMRLLLGEGGALLDEYRALCPVTIWSAPSPYITNAVGDKVLGKLGLWHQLNERKSAQQQRTVQQQLDLDAVDLVLVNTVTSSRWFRELAVPTHIPVVTFVHELAMSVRMYTRPDDLAYLLQRTTHLLAVSDTTARYYEKQWNFDPARITRFTLIDTPAMERAIGLARQQPTVYAELDLPDNALIVGGCGNAEWRKGNDLFIAIARQVIGGTPPGRDPAGYRAPEPPIHFVWVGVPAGTLRDDLELDIRKAGLTGRVHLIPPTPDVLRYMSRFDVFLLCSREDPYPLVVFEAGLSGVPVVCFADAGGSPELVETDGGAVVPYLDLDAMSHQILDLLQNPGQRQAMGQRLGEKIRERHAARQSVDTLLSLFAQLTA